MTTLENVNTKLEQYSSDTYRSVQKISGPNITRVRVEGRASLYTPMEMIIAKTNAKMTLGAKSSSNGTPPTGAGKDTILIVPYNE